MADTKQRKWLNALQALRGLAFVMVYVSHSFQFFQYWGNWGAIGVEFFLILSGFFSGYYFNEQKTRETGILKSCGLQLWKKLRQFWPLYILFVGVACIPKWSGVKNLLLNVFLLQSYCGTASIALTYNWVTWTLSSLMLSYLLSPILNLIANKPVQRVSHLAVCMGIVYVLQLGWAMLFIKYTKSYDAGYYYVYIFPVARMLDFFQGILIARIVRLLTDREPKHDLPLQQRYTLLEAIAWMVFIVSVLVEAYIPKIFTYSPAYVIPVACIVLLHALERGGISTLLAGNKALLWVGSVSFELYIIHRMTLLFTHDLSDTVIAWLLCTAFTLLLAEAAKLTRTMIDGKLRARADKKRSEGRRTEAHP